MPLCCFILKQINIKYIYSIMGDLAASVVMNAKLIFSLYFLI